MPKIFHPNTKWLKSFSVPGQGKKHILSLLPLQQGSLPKNKGTSGNNFLRRSCHRGFENCSSSKTSLCLKKKSTPKIFAPKFSEIWKRPKNREDSCDLDDFLIESIAATRSSFRKNFRAIVFRKFSRKLRETVVAGVGGMREASKIRRHPVEDGQACGTTRA